ncbi:MAG: HD-GYP domain-containing protein, partial [Coriobacteriia bacterium]|nr:HD-GYP domain-containing protein [Coriobacteriia bacterium]
MSGRRVEVYAVVLTLCAAVAGARILPTWTPSDWLPLLVLASLTLLLTNLAIELPLAVSVSLSFAPIFAGILIAGPFGGALLGLVSAFLWSDIRGGAEPKFILFNMAQLFLAGLGAGWAYAVVGNRIALGEPGTMTTSLIVSAVAVMVFFLLNILFVGIGVSLKTGMGLRSALGMMSPGSYSASLLVLALLGYVMAHLISMSSWVGLVLLVLPFAMARQTFRVYVELAEAYTETVRSLVAAIEAKDRYTRGHSERVAILARRLASRMGLMPAEVDLAERAALLHDVGKIGIAQATLTSPTKLSASEVRQIRRHPVIGAELADEVAFLSDIVPIVRHHHERIDGAGYPDGLVGTDIPLLARVLAVVDSYDAMTSDRAYRPGMD